MPELKPGLLGNDHNLVLNPVAAILPSRVALATTIEPNRHGILRSRHKEPPKFFISAPHGNSSVLVPRMQKKEVGFQPRLLTPSFCLQTSPFFLPSEVRFSWPASRQKKPEFWDLPAA